MVKALSLLHFHHMFIGFTIVEKDQSFPVLEVHGCFTEVKNNESHHLGLELTGCNKEVAALHSDLYIQVPLYTLFMRTRPVLMNTSHSYNSQTRILY